MLTGQNSANASIFQVSIFPGLRLFCCLGPLNSPQYLVTSIPIEGGTRGEPLAALGSFPPPGPLRRPGVLPASRPVSTFPVCTARSGS